MREKMNKVSGETTRGKMTVTVGMPDGHRETVKFGDAREALLGYNTAVGIAYAGTKKGVARRAAGMPFPAESYSRYARRFGAQIKQPHLSKIAAAALKHRAINHGTQPFMAK